MQKKKKARFACIHIVKQKNLQGISACKNQEKNVSQRNIISVFVVGGQKGDVFKEKQQIRVLTVFFFIRKATIW